MGQQVTKQERTARNVIKEQVLANVIERIEKVESNGTVMNPFESRINYLRIEQLQRGGHALVKNDLISIILKLRNLPTNDPVSIMKYARAFM